VNFPSLTLRAPSSFFPIYSVASKQKNIKEVKCLGSGSEYIDERKVPKGNVMATRALGEVVRYIRRLAGPIPAGDSDAELLARFARDGDQAAFAALVERHGRLVLGACRRILRREQDAEDVFQATFLVLVKKAPLTGTRSLASWLYIVARRLALKAQTQAMRQQECERRVARRLLEPPPEPVDSELLAILEEELQALPEKYRAPLVLCHLEGRTHEQAARDLGWPSGSLWKRLERGRTLLRDRLVRRGFSLSAGILTAAWVATPTEVPAALAPATVRLASLLTSASTVPPHLAGIVQGALRAAAYGRWKVTLVALIVALFGGTAGVVFQVGTKTPESPALQKQIPVADVTPARPEPDSAARDGDWPTFRGNASRGGRSRGEISSPTMRWTLTTTGTTQVKKWVEDALDTEQRAGAPVVPAFHPVTNGGLVIFRTHGGIQCVRADTGATSWTQTSRLSASELRADPANPTGFAERFEDHRQAGRGSVIFANANLGALSTDRELVYAVEEIAFSSPCPVADWHMAMRLRLPVASSLRESRLLAIELSSGKLVWQLPRPLPATEEGADLDQDFRDVHFLGAPLPVAGKLYFLFQRGRDVRLARLDATKVAAGTVEGTWTLTEIDDSTTKDFRRRLWSTSPAYADGILVCPTNAGKVIGFNPSNRSVAWTHQYQSMNLGEALDSGWKATGPIISGSKVVVTASDGADVACLGLSDGKLHWTTERGADVYVAGVFDNRVLLVGNASCRALNLSDGEECWKLDTGNPTGLGVSGDGVYYLPLANFGKSKEPEVCVIDVRRGSVRSHLKTDKKEAFGNLLLRDGWLLSQTANGLTAFTDSRKKTEPLGRPMSSGTASAPWNGMPQCGAATARERERSAEYSFSSS
jgi:RNA polymerase sigma factor (sigma-70 family)